MGWPAALLDHHQISGGTRTADGRRDPAEQLVPACGLQAERHALGGQATSSAVRWSQGAAATSKLFPQHPILVDQIAGDLGLPASHQRANVARRSWR
jgi:hypothetical protein